MSGNPPAGVFSLISEALAKMVRQLYLLVAQNQELRAIQADNAFLFTHYDQPGVFTTIGSVAVTNAVIYTIAEAQRNQGEKFAALILTFESTSPAGRFTVDGTQVSPTIGHEVPGGGIVLVITGMPAIRNFKLTSQVAAQLVFSRVLVI